MGTPNIQQQGPPTLNRWLNINSVLRNQRERGSVFVPTDQLELASHNLSAVWNGTFSDKVIQFNFAVTNNISLLRSSFFNTDGTFKLPFGDLMLWNVARHSTTKPYRPTFPLNPVGYASVDRFRLNNATDYTINLDGDYTGQTLGSSFSIEAWTTPSSDFQLSPSTAVEILTSILSPTVDVRTNGANFNIATHTSSYQHFENTSFSQAGVGWDLPMAFPQYIIDFTL